MYTDLISRYMDAFGASFLYYNAQFHTVKGGERFGQTDKYYPVDTGFIYLTKGNMSENYGSLLENVVFLELKRRGMKVSAGRNNDRSEVDFIAVKGAEKTYIQVSATLVDENTRKREFYALESISDNFPKLILSMDHHDFSCNGIRNIYIPGFLMNEDQLHDLHRTPSRLQSSSLLYVERHLLDRTIILQPLHDRIDCLGAVAHTGCDAHIAVKAPADGDAADGYALFLEALLHLQKRAAGLGEVDGDLTSSIR